MTKEDIKQICQIYDNLRRERDAATIAYNSEDTFWEHVLATYELSQPSLPSDLDEATEEYAPDFSNDFASKAAVEAIRDAFKTGAKWMAGQGETQEHFVISSIAGSPYGPAVVCYTEKFAVGDEVIVQIRKKQQP